MNNSHSDKTFAPKVISGLTEEAVVKLEHVNFSFGKNRALNDFSLEIAPRKLVGLIGPDGVGKSTMLSLRPSPPGR